MCVQNKCTLYIVHCTLYSVQRTAYKIHIAYNYIHVLYMCNKPSTYFLVTFCAH